MKVLRALIDIVKLPIRERVVAYRVIISKMTNNPNFPTPYIPLADATLAINAFEAAIIASEKELFDEYKYQ